MTNEVPTSVHDSSENDLDGGEIRCVELSMKTFAPSPTGT